MKPGTSSTKAPCHVEGELELGECDLVGVGVFPTLVPHLNGVPLPDLVGKAELPFARREGNSDLAGSYAGLLEDGVRWPSGRYPGDPALSWFGDGDTVAVVVSGHSQYTCLPTWSGAVTNSMWRAPLR
ncbi:hypothetical protein P3102_21750 [Amycolatopsis sp. QT-25]|uniref:hypothetical protein n=1 Tax=Amycolatopsis sp. QT-25 TaxID=3034022 RepID=UPI0023EBD322|nr:hypothetical protein [Amycolatopsis sp. QT-25]WET76735.1 hypothetical protein P3102_21750 [Amycolatopsis sp. QT-25]